MKLLKAIIHIMDKDSGNILLSQSELNLTNRAIESYLKKLIINFEKSEYIEVPAQEHLNLSLYKDDSFINITAKIAQDFFDTIKNKKVIPGGDLLFFKAKKKDEVYIYGFFKLNYNSGYINNVRFENNKIENDIILSNAVLPSSRKKIDEGIIIEENESLRIKSKIYEDEQGQWSLAKDFLKISNLPNRVSDTINSIKVIVDATSKSFGEDKLNTTINLKSAISESLKMENTIDNDYIADKVFMDNEFAKEDFKDKLKHDGIKKVIKVPNSDVFDKKYSKQKIKLDNGIEISIPTKLIKNKEIVEFKTADNGKNSVIIKNVNWMKEKF